MKKTILFSSIILIACIAITSCKKSSTNNSIVGKWKLTSGSEVLYDSTTTPLTKTSQDTTYTGNTSVAQFNADNSFSILDSVGDAHPEVGTYIYANDSITIVSTTTQKLYCSVAGNSLSIQLSTSSGHKLGVLSENFTRQ